MTSSLRSSSDRYRPGGISAEVETKLARFEAMNKWVTARGGWVTSIPGAAEITVECLPDSPLPQELRAAGYEVEASGEGQRILAGAIVERFTRRTGGELVPLTTESTVAAAETRTHAGICRVERYSFTIP